MSLIALEEDLTAAVERLRPSVVSVSRPLEGRGRTRGNPGVRGAGTGIIVASRGFLVTNHHVVEGTGRVDVRLADGTDRSGEVVGADAATDLAVVRVDGRDLPAADLADSDRLRTGQFALAVGNSLGLPGGPSVSLGVVSALGRPLPGSDFIFEGLIQTDAAINPGNSGGPLANLRGEVIGINAAMIPYAQGVGFAIPSNAVRRVMDQILAGGRVIRPWLGISGLAVDASVARRFRLATTWGVLVMEVVEDGPATKASISTGDVIQRVGPSSVHSLPDLLKALAHVPIGGRVDIGLVRNGVPRTAMVQLQEAPPLPA
ncbi:MAG: trypsin-like peptidase domain-containing protein [Thermoplasmata archaeon]